MTKRQIASWVLLAVYLPMLLISSLHIHEAADWGETACAECVHHQCHGHLNQLSEGMHQCVLCQILTLTYIATATGAILYYLPQRKSIYVWWKQVNCQTYKGFICLRAPPAA